MNEPKLSDDEESTAHELLLLQRAIAINNAAFVDSSAVSAVHPCGNSNDLLQSLKKGLTSFHELLVQRSGIGSSNADLGLLTTHEVSLSFGAPVLLLRASQLEESSTTRSALVPGTTRSPHTETFASFYIFSRPVVFYYSNLMVRAIDSHPSSSRRTDSSRIGTRSISVLVGCSIFNIALLNHQRVVVQEGNNELRVRQVLMKSLKLYESAQVLLQRRVDDLETICQQERKQGPSTMERGLQDAPGSFLQEEKKMLTLLLIATWNNMSQIHYFLENFAQSQLCIVRLLTLIRNTRCCRHDHIATDLLNQVLLNVLLLQKDPHSRPAAAA